ncbi:MAG: gamma-glutamylcyclotransferase family protein [Promethearchaeota archaeon]
MIDNLDKVKIFSYGSNMYSKRLVKRVQSAEIRGIGKAQGFKIEFSKKSKDNSGKATLIRTTNKSDIIWGTISTILKKEKHLLDEAEGLREGYNEEHIRIKNETNEDLLLITYIADDSYIDKKLVPYSWYKTLVVEGAKENGLPEKYIEKLELQKAKEDKNIERAKSELKILEE